MQDDFSERTRSEWRFPAFVVVAGIVVGLIYHASLWTLDSQGLSAQFERLPYWDFSNLWSGSRMAIEGHIAVLFDVDAYRSTLRAWFTPVLPDQEWSYPPSILLVGVPLALLPISLAYLVWTAGTVGVLHLAIRPLRLPLAVHVAVLASPAVFMNALFGQNGALTAALLVSGLLAAPRRPVLAGILFGLLTIKPHLGILVPFCLIASRNWKAFASAALATVVLALVTGLAFGVDVWSRFLTETGPLMTAIMEAPYPQTYHANALTVFILARSLGLDLASSYAVQAVATLAAIATAVWLWLPSNPIDHRRRVVATAALAILATPYGYTYDTIPMCLAVAWLFAAAGRPALAPLAIAWLFPYAVHMLNYHGVGLAVLVPATVAAAVVLTRPTSPVTDC